MRINEKKEKRKKNYQNIYTADITVEWRHENHEIVQ